MNTIYSNHFMWYLGPKLPEPYLVLRLVIHKCQFAKKNRGFLDGIWDVVLKKISLEIFENKSNCNWKFYNYWITTTVVTISGSVLNFYRKILKFGGVNRVNIFIGNLFLQSFFNSKSYKVTYMYTFFDMYFRSVL